jgi:protein gp37
MSANTKIEWCDHTQNFWEGCQKAGIGCDGCYAEARNARFGGGVAVNWGPGAPRRRTSEANWRKPLVWNANHATFFAEHGRRQRVFCSSLSDWADNAVPDEWRLDAAKVILATPDLDWLLLTKRIGNAAKMLAAMFPNGMPTNVWIGATIVNQEEADRDITKLLAVPAVKHFLSMEPLLGPVDLSRVWVPNGILRNMVAAITKLDWVIAGGESGIEARPSHPNWYRSLRDQCKAAGVPFLFKQWGEWSPEYQPHKGMCVVMVDGEVLTPPNCLSRPSEDGEIMVKVGKKAAGRHLDGRTWDGVPS